MGAGFDKDPVFQSNIGGAEDLFPAIHGVGDVMEAARYAGVIFGDGDVVAFVIRGKPDALG